MMMIAQFSHAIMSPVSKQWKEKQSTNQSVAWPHHFFIHRWIPDKMGTVPVTSARSSQTASATFIKFSNSNSIRWLTRTWYDLFVLASYSLTPICVRTSGLSSLIVGRRIVCVYVQVPTRNTPWEGMHQTIMYTRQNSL